MRFTLFFSCARRSSDVQSVRALLAGGVNWVKASRICSQEGIGGRTAARARF